MILPSDQELRKNPSLFHYLRSYKAEAQCVIDAWSLEDEWSNIVDLFPVNLQDKANSLTEEKKIELFKLKQGNHYFKFLVIELTALSDQIIDVHRQPHPHRSTITLDQGTRVDNYQFIFELKDLRDAYLKTLKNDIECICYEITPRQQRQS